MQGTEDQCLGRKISAWDRRLVTGPDSARDKRSTLRTFHGVIHGLLTCILHAQTRCRSVHERGFTTGQKTLENQDWASGPPGHRRRGPGALGPWAVGRCALGPPGRWAFRKTRTKNGGNSGPGRRAIMGHGPRAAGPSRAIKTPTN